MQLVQLHSLKILFCQKEKTPLCNQSCLYYARMLLSYVSLCDALGMGFALKLIASKCLHLQWRSANKTVILNKELSVLSACLMVL